jgi:CHASE2 domain-containing sensor protein
MKKSFFRQIWNIEYAISSIVVMGLVYLMGFISGLLPEADETSFLNPIFDRIDFLNIEDVSLDAIFAMKPAGFPDERIVIINVGEVAPAPDGKIAEAINRVHNYGAKVIGIDVIFDALHFERFPEDRHWERDALIDAFKTVPNVVIVNGYDNETLTESWPLDPEVRTHVDYYGYASLDKDDDGVVRRFWPYRTIEGQRWLSFPTMITAVYDENYVQDLLDLPELPQIIYYKATHNQFKGQTLPIDDVISHPEALASVYKKIFDGAIVLIGFVNEGGMWYPDDTHKTPMGKKISIEERDGSSRMGMDGPDMSGLLIHANAINMMLTHDFISPVPEWVDWLMVFLLSYISIALYRVFRTKPASRFAIVALITLMLAVETLIVFFLPIIAFFNYDLKISYNLMATAVLLFIPANAIINSARVLLLRWMRLRKSRLYASPSTEVMYKVFQDDESFPLYIRIIHAALYSLHFTMHVCTITADSGKNGIATAAHPRLDDWIATIPELGALFSGNARDVAHSHFYRYLDGMKDRFLRDNYVKDFFFHTEFSKFNPHHYFEEWEIVLPHVFRMVDKDLHSYMQWRIAIVEMQGDEKNVFGFGTSLPTSIIQELQQHAAGIYMYLPGDNQTLKLISPFCIYTECKLHRNQELFVFAAAVPKQLSLGKLPVYYGETIACEPVLSEAQLQSLFHSFEIESSIINREE